MSLPTSSESMAGPLAGAFPPPSFPVPSLDSTYGPVLISTFFGLILYGVALLQVYQYARNRFGDSTLIKCFVGLIVIFGSFHAALTMHTSYWYLVTNYFRPDRLLSIVWSSNLLAITTAAVIITCQCFFAYRVYFIGGCFRPVVYLAGIMFMAEFAIAMAGTVKLFLLKDVSKFGELAWVNSAGFAFVVASDVMLTSVLVWVLHKSRTEFKDTNSKIDVLIAYAVCTGFVTNILSVFGLIMALVKPNNSVYLASDVIITHLYINSVLAALNCRRSYPSSSLNETKVMTLSIVPQSGSVTSGGSERWDTSLHLSFDKETNMADLDAAATV